MFTRNQIVAAPVTVGREHMRRGQGLMRALIVNAGNANCATGKQGLKAAANVCAGLAKQIKASPHQVFPSSTGIIGVQLPVEKIYATLPQLVSSATAGEQAFDQFANAILTTDTHKKVATQSITFNQAQVILAGVAKGAGMIHPNMATMLVYLFTDLSASPRELQTCLQEAADQSFNNISIDGDTSTNDTALLLASGKSGVQFKSVRNEFQAALTKVCRSLAGQIVADGEGVKHVVRLNIEQARTRGEARQIGSAIANSPLVKTAWAGADPNWDAFWLRSAIPGSKSIRSVSTFIWVNSRFAGTALHALSTTIAHTLICRSRSMKSALRWAPGAPGWSFFPAI